ARGTAVSLPAARTIVERALAHARSSHFPPLTVAVLDAAGRRVQTDYFLCRGVESELEVSVAVANSGELQLELIQPRNDASSAFTEFLDAGHEGAQRVAYRTEDFQRLYDNALSLGYTVTQEGSIGGEHGRFAYLDTEHDHGTAIEICDISGPTGPFFSDIRDAAANWDGTDPIRRRR